MREGTKVELIQVGPKRAALGLESKGRSGNKKTKLITRSIFAVTGVSRPPPPASCLLPQASSLTG